MKIITWNVNGIRAALGKNALDWAFAQQPDALCLQEIKARPEQLGEPGLPSLADYHSAWNPAARPGYSGVATFSRTPPHETRLGFGVGEFDAEGRLIASRFDDFWLFRTFHYQEASQATLQAREGMIDQDISAGDIDLELDHGCTAWRYQGRLDIGKRRCS